MVYSYYNGDTFNWQTLYLNKPITCWAPVHFTGAHTKFMTSYCWVRNTYYLPWDDQVPMSDTEKRQMVPYYQWIPFILLAQVGNDIDNNIYSQQSAE